jgi:carboxyl-terminal processing protease
VSALVIDIRGNAGGLDQMVADMMASFYTKRSFYEYQSYLVPETGRFQIWKTDDQTGDYLDRNQGIWIEPGKRPYTGPIAVLIDNGCISSCEGVAMGLSRLPNATLVGFYGTNGSFGMVGDGVLMPGGQQIGWPFGQSLDRRKRIQIDSRDLVGGVAPDVRVPITVRTMGRTLQGHDVLLRTALRELEK